MKERRFHLTGAPVFWGLVLILAAAALILDGAGVSFGAGITALHIVGGILLLAWLVTVIVKGRFWGVFFPLAFLFMLFEAPLAGLLGREDPNIISNWLVLLAALLLTVGFRLLFRRRKTGGMSVGSRTLYLDGGDLSDVRISENLGQVNVYVTNPERYTGGGKITVSENLGQVVLHIPGDWFVRTESRENLGAVSVPVQTYTGGKEILLYARENLGQVTVRFEAPENGEIRE
ncbi:MAG: hypothetical protein IKX85_06285 [Clostridia bacterium]|nr:hypothetical protein [Clostridia bacterium]